MPKIIRHVEKMEEVEVKPQFRVNLNITLNGSKRMSAEQQDELLPFETLTVHIYHPEGGTMRTLVLESIDAKEFSTGSVGWSLQVKNAEFQE